MMWLIISISACLQLFVYMACAETIERNVGVLGSPATCTDSSTQCIINCNVVNACRATTLDCGSADDCVINLRANYAAYATTIVADGIRSLTINAVDATYAFQLGTLNVGTLSGDLTISSTGSGLGSFHNSNVNVGSIGGDLLVEETPNAAAGRSFKYIEIAVTGNIGGSATFAARNDNGRTDYQAFDLSKIRLTSVGGDAKFISNMFGTFSECLIEISGDVAGNVEFTDTSTYGRGFCCSPTGSYGVSVLGTISGNVVITDDSTDGYAGYNTDFVFGDVLGNVVVTSSSKHSYEATSWTFGEIGGSMTFSADGSTLQAFTICEVNVASIGGALVMEETPTGAYGRTFKHLDLHVSGNVGEGARFEAHNDNGRIDYQTFDLSSIVIDGSVGGDAQFLSNMFGAFSECKVQIGGDVAGNVDIIDTSTYGRGFCCSPGPTLGFTFLGTVSGDVNIRDESTDGHAGYNTDFTFNNVLGNVNVIDAAGGPYAYHSAIFNFPAVSGYLQAKSMTTASGAYKGFDHTTWDIGSVGGDVLFQSVTDFLTADSQPFDVSSFTIDSVGGDCTFSSATFGTFSECDINIGSVTGTTSFVGSASHGYDFYNTDIDIESSPNVVYRTDNHYAMYLLDSVFGSGVGLVDIAVDGGSPHALHAASFDARAADEVMMNCYQDGDCTDFKIYCPENNLDNKCKVFCGANANCVNIDLYTTNGYCHDASFYCHDTSDPTGCSLDTSNQVFCTTGTAYAYGVAGTYCTMKKDITNNHLYCDDVGSAQCSTEQNCPIVTPEPTPAPITAKPTSQPTTAKPTANPVTPAPTTPPPTTPAPTTPAPTYEPCTVSTDAYNVQFTFDESGSVGLANYVNSVALHSEQDAYNVQFTFDESGSVGLANYVNSVDFVQDLVGNSVSSAAKVAVLSFSTNNDEVYAFTQTQSSRTSVLSALETEKSDYAGQFTDTYNALLQAFAQFDADSSITSSDNNMMFLITDGTPSCTNWERQNGLCVEQICTSDTNKNTILNGLQSRHITLYILGIGSFDSSEISCLVENQDASQQFIYGIEDFSAAEFKEVESQFRAILCPGAAAVALPNNIDDDEYNNNKYGEQWNDYEQNKWAEERERNKYNYNGLNVHDENKFAPPPTGWIPFVFGAVVGALVLAVCAFSIKVCCNCYSKASHQYKSVAINDTDSEAV
eukprot:CAMPEP_0197077004 /NCGR_PEP_ID=MMETSP1384-20130603/212396_1 /TAXON_ID=29189 /ORGANISM="Ammonia sp." /LENGTH=1178 /DNA_ID=CAMNT_0042515863 /DNA_START=58 /DNA_END=3595 /DNA_ORIENTATION=-